MRTSTLRLGLTVLAALGLGMNRLHAQQMAPVASQLFVVPAVAYEPAHPKQDPAAAAKGVSPLTPVGYQEFQDAAPQPSYAPPIDFNPTGIPPQRFWARGEYLLWWVKDAPLPVPLVTTGNPNVGFPTLNTAGAIGQPGTQVLLGNQDLDFQTLSGMRFTFGGWIDHDRTIGLEVSGFLLEHKPFDFQQNSDITGNNPPLYYPRYNPAAGIQDAVPIADPLRGFAGGVTMVSYLQLWGVEANTHLNLVRQPGVEFTLLGGFRYANLTESLQLQSTSTDLGSGNISTISDTFSTGNHFYGGQFGGQLVLERYGFSLDVTGKLALGSNQQVLNVQGSTTQFGPNALIPPGVGTTPGGFYAEPSNIGQRTANQFSVIPSIELNLSYQITPDLRAFVGYTFMYWTGVIRPGDQINHSVNVTQNAVLDPNGVGQLVGPAQPAPLFNRSDFWAHGFNLGFELRF